MSKSPQEVAIQTNYSKVVVNAAAASGKTFVITERVKWLILQGVPKDKIVVITFTNNAAEEMKTRLGELSNGVFINTIHSYVNYLLLSAGIDTRQYLDAEKFDELFKLVKQNPHCIKLVEHLLLDEAQDSDELQWEFILDYVKPQNWFVVGDTNQAIYGFKGASPEIMEDLMHQSDTVTFNLLVNHRNDKSILNFAKRIINKNNFDNPDESISNSNEYGQVIETDYSLETLVNYINATIKQGNCYKNWFVLGRSNQQVQDMYNYLTTHNIPCDTFKRAEMTNAELSKRLADDTVKVLTIHSSKGLENDYVAVQGGLFYNDEERRVCYVAATRAKHLLLWFRRPKKVKPKKTQVFNWE